MIAWTFFRSNSVLESFEYLKLMLINFDIPNNNRLGILYIIIIIILDWIMRGNERNPISFNNTYFRRMLYLILSYMIFVHFKFIDFSKFIYFQF